MLNRPIIYRQPSTFRYFVRQICAKTPLPYVLVTTWLYNNTRRGMAEQVTGEVRRLLGRDPIALRQYI